MKHTLLMYLTVLLTLIIHGNNYAQQKTAPYFKIGQSLENFKGHFNSFSKKCGSELRITGFKTSVETEYNIFEYSFNKNLSIIGQLNKSDNSIHAINVTLGAIKLTKHP